MRRVVITGIGAVTPLGNDIETTWENLTGKISGIGRITKFDPSGLSSRIAGEVKDFSPEYFIPGKDVQRLDPFIHYAAAAAIMAAEDAGLVSAEVQKRKSAKVGSQIPKPAITDLSLVTRHSSLEAAGIVIGSSRGGITSMEKALIRAQSTEHRTQTSASRPALHALRFSAYLMSSSTISMAASYISMRLGIKGPALGISTACASGTNAIGEAFRMIRHGEIDVALAGGADAPVCKLAVGGYAASGALSKRNNEPQKASRPFDKDRDGFVLSEGAGLLILEELKHALKRGAKIYAELAGYGASSDAFHQTQPDSAGEAIAISKALTDAKVSTDDVDYINAHATSTPLGDIAEAQAINKVFGKRAKGIYINSCKSMLGHMLGAAGAVETAITALSINKGMLIPTINLETPAPKCDLNHVTSTIKKEINVAVTNSFGFGGVNAVLVLKKFK
ncbi:MAG: beta-ketoacyl-[acyl-carrier-protein] synthase II [Nitrospirae bacterium]|nr:beta-ketoacyl-[acyl-carrier-protein] synthase II [Nitrospirota bacterium]